ncbi:hypothetical protein [Kitasatospora sp. NPDC086791]|uniref:hypothetical protein n=1 Tax=Kitasatospora sp. NPDC086791 TaxID=3155178 RepID=UPI00341E4309
MRHADPAEQTDLSNPAQWLLLAILGGLFTLGLQAFRHKLTPRSLISQSPRLHRVFPKLWGGLVMTVTGMAAITMILSALGLHPTAR